jgi:hypothetical protein
VKPGGKGRPTPKRSEAEASRRKRATVPRDRKEAAREARARAKAERQALRHALVAGDENALPKRDRGPVRRLVRDIVDARRNVGAMLLPFAFAGLLFGSLPPVRAYTFLLWPILLSALMLDSLALRGRVRRLVAERYPGESQKGLFMYALLRSTQLRRLRLPPPRIQRATRSRRSPARTAGRRRVGGPCARRIGSASMEFRTLGHSG